MWCGEVWCYVIFCGVSMCCVVLCCVVWCGYEAWRGMWEPWSGRQQLKMKLQASSKQAVNEQSCLYIVGAHLSEQAVGRRQLDEAAEIVTLHQRIAPTRVHLIWKQAGPSITIPLPDDAWSGDTQSREMLRTLAVPLNSMLAGELTKHGAQERAA